MLGINFLLHSIKLVFSNWQTAVRISSPLIFVVLVFGVLLGGIDASYDLQDPSGGVAWGSFILFVLAQMIAGLWVAVAWHRYVLLEEDSGTILPNFKGDRMGAYFVQGLVIGLIVLLAAMAAGAVLGLVLSLAGGMVGVAVTTIAVMGVALWLFYRLSPKLPAAALAEDLTIGDAWGATKGGYILN